MLNYKIIKNEFLEEETYVFNHDSGLTIYISPKKGYSKKTAYFATHFGSVDNTFKSGSMKEFKTIPDGVAHFLEHKLFESEEGDAFSKYAETGANANAYTSFTHTAYYFTCTNRFEENLKILVDLIQTPYFTDENVNKEQGIIGQEINMYLDNPSWRVYFNLLESMYHSCSVKKDIAGSVESISKITPELLYECYRNFYNASNMVLCICGDVNPIDTANYIDELLTNITPKIQVELKESPEEKSVLKNTTKQNLSVSMPIFNIGFKDNDIHLTGDKFIKSNLIGKIVLDVLFGRSSKFYEEFYNKGLINESFDIEYNLEQQFAHSIIAGESDDPEAVYEEVLKTINYFSQNGIEKADFDRQIKIAKSAFISQFNNIERTARSILESHFNKFDLYNCLDVYDTVTTDDILNGIKKLNKDLSVLSVINPLE